MAQKRIYQIAKELNISHVEIIKFLKSKSIEVANHMAPVDNNIYDSILMEFSKEKASIDRQRKERARKAIISNKEDIVEDKPVELIADIEIDTKKDKKTEEESEQEKEVKKDETEKSKEIGYLLAGKLKSKKINKFIFDRNGYRYHGRVKALADGIREKGIKF